MLASLILAFTTVFVAMDIIGMIPMYMSMTRGLEDSERRRLADTSIAVAFLVAFVFALLGQTLFGYLGIGIPDFKIAGGIVLLLIALADLLGGPEAVHQRSSPGSTGVVPLGVPLITGPAVLTTLILQVSTLGYSVTIIAMILNYLIAWVLLRNSQVITRLLGKDTTVVISKIAALLLAAIAVAMIRTGVFQAVQEFGK